MPVTDPSIQTPADKARKAEQAKQELPPAGDAQREVLKKRLETLQAEVERVCSELGIERADPKNLKIERETAQLFAAEGDLPISGLRTDYQYALVWRDPFNRLGGRVVFSYLREGWEVVKGDMLEGKEAMSVTGERWYSDCLLMRMRRDLHEHLQRQRIAQRIAREEGVPAAMLDLADRIGAKVTYGPLPDGVAQQAMAQSESSMRPLRDEATRRRAQDRYARTLALNKLDGHLRAGTMPGAEIPPRR